MTWTDQIVRLRFVEAADTLMHLQVGGLRPAKTGNAWLMAVDGWDGYGAEATKVRHRPDPSAISRYEEVQAWLQMIGEDDTRTMVWARAMCEAARRSFASWCAENEIVRRTAYRRTDKAFQDIAATLCKRGAMLRVADEERMSQLGAVSGMDEPTLRAAASPRFERADDDARDMGLPADPDAFAKWLAQTNAARRKEQERRRRAKMKRIEEGLAA